MPRTISDDGDPVHSFFPLQDRLKDVAQRFTGHEHASQHDQPSAGRVVMAGQMTAAGDDRKRQPGSENSQAKIIAEAKLPPGVGDQ